MSKYNQQELQLLKDKVRTLFDSNPNWTAIGLQLKEKDGILTDDIAITLTVDKKLPVDQIDSNDLFPESIIIPGVSEPVNTDVKVGATMTIPSDHRTPCYTLPVNGHDKGQPEAVDEGGDWVMPVSGHRSTHRPLVGGISVGIFPPRGFDHPRYLSFGGGTLGGFAIDLDDNTIVGISNNHILANATLGDTLANETSYADSAPLSAHTNSKGVTFWSFLSTNDTTVSTNPNTAPETHYPVYQRSNTDEYTSWKSVLDPLKIGTVKRAYPFVKTDQASNGNKLDIAIFALDTTVPNLSSTTENWKQYLMNYNQPMDWATTDEIDSLIDASSPNYKAPVFKSARTTGPVGWPGSSPYGVGNGSDHTHTTNCSLSVYNINGATNTYKDQPLGRITFIDQLEYRGDVTDPSQGGDSGAFVCALLSAGLPALSAWKVIGLHYASGHYDGGDDIGVANRIDNIATMFNLSAYKGEDLAIGYKNVDIQVVNSRQSGVTAMIDGNMYWQAGSTNDFGPPGPPDAPMLNDGIPPDVQYW